MKKPKINVRIYAAHAMTGRKKADLINEAYVVEKIMKDHGIDVYDPVKAEGIELSNEILIPKSESELRQLWKADKKLIVKSDIVLDLTGPMKSEGVMHEIGYARYFLFKPVIRVYPSLGFSVARFEDDAVVGTIDEAADLIVERWGTWQKRFVWRLKILFRCLPKIIWYQILAFF